MAKETSENLPDIDDGLKELSQETTAADLLRQQGQRKKLKVINRNQLKAQIQEWIRKAVEEGVADAAGSLSQEERDAIMRQTEERVQEAMRKSQQEEARRQAAEVEREQLAARVNSLAEEQGANEALKQSIQELQERLQRAELVADESQQDVLAMEADLENIQKMHQATRHEKEQLENTLRQHMLHTTDLVSLVLGIDNDYYGSRHQNDNPAGEEADPAQAFFHDFQVGAQVTETLSQDLGKLREITAQQAEQEASSGAQPQLLEQDLALLEQLKQGSLSAVELSAPVENLVEALEGARGEVVALQESSAADGEQSAPITALPADDGDPAEVLQGATHVVREMQSALAAARARITALSDQGAESEKAKQALRENMIRTTDLVQGVLALDNAHYGGRHQNENPVPDGVEGQEEFYHDFDVGGKVIDTLSADLARLSELTKDEDKYSGLLDSDLALLEQLKQGSLQAMDVAAPVANLVEALDGARSEASELNREADEALHLPVSGVEISALPDPDGKPDEVIAGATKVARELGAALASERKRLMALRALADEADDARQGSEQELEASRELLTAIAEQGNDFGVEVPPELADESAPGDQRVAAAKAVLDGLHAKLEAEAATVDELSTTLESVLGDEVAAAENAEAGAAESAEAQRAILGELKGKVDQLGESYQRLRKAYVGSRVREQALADQLQALARDLDPELAQDQASEVGIELGKVEQVLDQDKAEGAKPTAEDEQRGEQLGSAIDGLIASMRRRASEGGIGGAPAEEVEALAREVLEIAKADEDVAGHEVTIDLAMGVDAEVAEKPNAQEMLASTKRVVEVLSARRTVLAEDLAAAQHEKERLGQRVDELEARITALNQELEGERTGRQTALAEVDGTVKAKDEELAALRIELEENKEALLSGKEIIGVLNDKEQRHAAELEALKVEQAQLRADVAGKATRLSKAEAANRQLTETLSEVSQAMLQEEVEATGNQELEDARVELEVALSELPAEESPDIPVREDIADDLANAGRQVIERIRAREAALVARVAALEAEKAGLESARDEALQASQAVKAQAQTAGDDLGKAEARIGILQQELEEANQAVTAKRKELGLAKEELATTKADMEALQRKIGEQDEQINALQADTSEADKVRTELEQARQELTTAYEGEREIASALNALAGWSGELVDEFDLQKKRDSQRYTRSRDKLEQAVGDEETDGVAVVERSKELATQVQGQAALITEHMRQQREQAAKLYADNDAIRGRISSLEATVADREYQLSQAKEEAERIRGEVESSQGAIEASQAEAAKHKDLLKQARAALDEYKAREGEHAGGVEGQVQKLRQELDDERGAREEAEAKLASLRDDLEGTIAGLRSRTDELDKRIAERDDEILRLQTQLDEELSQRLDTAEGKARLQALQAEVESERSLRKELERQVEEFKGGVGAEMSKAQNARGELMEKLRKLEGELGEERGKAEALKASKENLRKDLGQQMNKIKAQLGAEREAKEQLESSERSLREELAGLRARLRTLTSTDEE